MIREIAFGFFGNILFSLCLFAYKRNHHVHYDEIIRRLDEIEHVILEKQFLNNAKYLKNDDYFK